MAAQCLDPDSRVSQPQPIPFELTPLGRKTLNAVGKTSFSSTNRNLNFNITQNLQPEVKSNTTWCQSQTVAVRRVAVTTENEHPSNFRTEGEETSPEPTDIDDEQEDNGEFPTKRSKIDDRTPDSFHNLLELLRKRDWCNIRRMLNKNSCDLLKHPCNFVALCRVKGSYNAGVLQEFVQRLRTDSGDDAVQHTVNAAIDTMGNTPLSASIHSLVENIRHTTTLDQPQKPTSSHNTKPKTSAGVSTGAHTSEGLAKLNWLLELGATPSAMLNPTHLHVKVRTPPVFDWMMHWMTESTSSQILQLLLHHSDKALNPATLYSDLLYIAAGVGNVTIVRSLLQADHNTEDIVNARFFAGCTPLMRALDTGHFEVATLLLDHGAHPNCQNIHGQTPGYFALKKAAPYDLLLKMVKLNMDIYAMFPAGTRLLHAACYFSDLDAVLLLLQYGDSLDVDGGCTVKPRELLPQCIQNTLKDPSEVVLHLRRRSANSSINAPFNMLYIATVLCFSDMVRDILYTQTSMDRLQPLDIDQITLQGCSLLTIAIRMKHFDIALQLLNHHASLINTKPSTTSLASKAVSVSTTDNITAIDVAITHGAPVEVFQAMIRNGFTVPHRSTNSTTSPTSSSHDGTTMITVNTGERLLNRACVHGRVDVIALLVTNGELLDDCRAQLSTTISSHVVDTVPEACRKLFSDPDTLLNYVYDNNVPGHVGVWYLPLFRELIRAGHMPEKALFYFACSLGLHVLVTKLLKYDARCINDTYSSGRTALSSAMERKQYEIVSMLLEKGANPNAAAKGTPTAGFFAIKTGAPENVFTALLDHGLDVKSTLPKTCIQSQGLLYKCRLLHVACLLRRFDLMLLLVAAGDSIRRRGGCFKAPQDLLKDLPKKAFSRTTAKVPHNHLKFNNEHQCAVCLEDFDSHVTILKCGHVFDIGCTASLVEHNTKHCPLCRKPFEAKAVVSTTALRGVEGVDTPADARPARRVKKQGLLSRTFGCCGGSKASRVARPSSTVLISSM
eukprot:m.159675 g.159675  ORF g.159675 m.159675 type:complete len:1010 (+) comp31147_c0_seq1:610-3639(+)